MGFDEKLKQANEQLFNAAASGNLFSVKEALRNGADINSRHILGASSLFVAVTNNEFAVAKFLIENGADIELGINTGTTPLYKSAHSCHPMITKLLCDNGANKEALIKGYTALYAAISQGCLQDVKVLLQEDALLYTNNSTATPLLIASQEKNADAKHKQIHKLVMEHYNKDLEKIVPKINAQFDNSRSFEVVVVRYDEDLSWLNYEFRDERIIIYNKGEDDLDLKKLPKNVEIVNIPNLGWFGGTILSHLAEKYDELADRTLFLQGEPYEQHIFSPFVLYKGDIKSKCTSILANCVETTLLEKSDDIENITPRAWEESKYGGKFRLFSNYSMIDFAKEYIDEDVLPDYPLQMVWGAQFAIDKEKVHYRDKEFYQRMLPLFNETYPMADFYLEKLWNKVFEVHSLNELDSKLYNAAFKGNDDDVIKFLEQGANINSQHTAEKVTPLLAAIDKGRKSTVKLLVEKGADPNLAMRSGDTPLHKASYRCDVGTMEELIGNGANIESFAQEKLYTPLYMAVYNKCNEGIKVLLDAGALVHTDITEHTSIRYAKFSEQKDPEFQNIFNLLAENYHNSLLGIVPKLNAQFDSSKSFEVVVVRYNEDLSWLNYEFKDERIIIYNKGKDDLDLENLPKNVEIINIPNVGWFGGTILSHLAERYDNIADNTLFLQGEPYEQPAFLPFIRYKGEINSQCKYQNIVGKGEETTLQLRSDEFVYGHTEEEWSQTKYAGKFKLFSNYTMIDFAREYIDPNISPEDPLCVVWGAQFSVSKEKVHHRDKEFYQRMLPLFNETYPMADFYIEKLWDKIFDKKDVEILNKLLFEAAFRGDNKIVISLLENGANINSQHTELGATPLYAAVANNQTSTVQLLLDNGADLDIPITSGMKPIHKSITECNPELTKIIINAGANIEDMSLMGRSPLYFAIKFECTQSVQHLLEANASTHYDVESPRIKIMTPIFISSQLYDEPDRTNATEAIYNIVLDHYYNISKKVIEDIEEKTINNTKTFEVVVVRYKEDLSWVKKEFPHENVTIYNKGPNDLHDFPSSYKIINVPNVGYLGGTYLQHIVDRYNSLADRTMFMQGYPYDTHIFFPIIRHKNMVDSKCKNIIANCANTTLEEEWNFLSSMRWDSISRYQKFAPRDANMIEYTHKYIGNIPINETIYVNYGAIFAVDKEKILNCSKEYYEAMLPEFNSTYPMVDHYQERLWDPLFEYCKEM